MSKFEADLKGRKEADLKDRKKVFEEALQLAKIAFESRQGTSHYDKLNFEANQQAEKKAFETLQRKLQRELDSLAIHFT